MLHALDGETNCALKGEIPQGGPAILVDLFYTKPPALQRDLLTEQVTVHTGTLRILLWGSGQYRRFLFRGSRFRYFLLGPLHCQPFSGLLVRHNLPDLFQIVLGLPFAGEVFLDALIIHINLISNVVPHSVAILSFGEGKAFIRLWHTGGSLFHIDHDLLNKGVGIPFIRVNDFSIHNASFCESSADGGRVYLRERVILCLLYFRLLFLCLLFVVLLLRKGHHLVKIQVGEKFIQVTEAGALDGRCLRTVHQIGQAEGYQVGADLHGMGAVAGGAERQGDMGEVGEVGLLLKDFHAVGVNEPFCPLQLRLRHVNDLKALGRRV